MLNRSMYLFVAQVSGYATRMVLPVFLVRILTKAAFGLYNQFFLVEALIESIFQLGSNQALYFFVPRDEKNAGAYFLNSLVLNVVVFSLAYTFIGIFRHQVADFLGMPVVADLFWQLFGYTMMMMIGISAECYLNSRRYVKQAAFFVFSRHLLVSIVTVWAAYTYRRIDMVITALVVARAVGVVGVLLYIQFKLRGFRTEVYFIQFWKQFRYGVVLGMVGILMALLTRLHQIAVTKNYDVETFAVYSAGLRQIPVLRLYGQSISAVAMAEFAKFEKNQQWDKIRELWTRVLEHMYGIGVPVTLFLLLISEPLITFLFTPEYADAVPIFRINTVGMMYLVLNPSLVLRAMDRNDISVKVQASFLAAAPLALYLGHRLGGPVGIIAANSVLMLGLRIVTLVVLNRMIEVRLPYFVAPSQVLRLYKTGFRKGKGFLADRLSSGNGST